MTNKELFQSYRNQARHDDKDFKNASSAQVFIIDKDKSLSLITEEADAASSSPAIVNSEL